jgi:hypothetical protein
VLCAYPVVNILKKGQNSSDAAMTNTYGTALTRMEKLMTVSSVAA